MKTFSWRNMLSVSIPSLPLEATVSELLPLHQCVQKPSSLTTVPSPSMEFVGQFSALPFSTLVLMIRIKGTAFSSCYIPST